MAYRLLKVRKSNFATEPISCFYTFSPPLTHCQLQLSRPPRLPATGTVTSCAHVVLTIITFGCRLRMSPYGPVQLLCT